MFNSEKLEISRMVAAAGAALLMSTATIAVTAAPVPAAAPCVAIGAQVGQPLVCSYA